MKKPTVLITGGAKRIGQQMALFLAKRGYQIALHYHHSKSQALALQQQIIRQKGRCELFMADLSLERDVKRLVSSVNDSLANLTLLINNASIFVPNELGAQDLHLFHQHWDINFKAPYILACEFKRIRHKGHIINMIDTHINKNQSRHQDYLLTKKALAEFTKMAALSWGPAIRVNGISPGMILPPVNGQKDDRLVRSQQIPLKRVGDPSYIIGALGYLLDNDYVTGEILNVDGGESLL